MKSIFRGLHAALVSSPVTRKWQRLFTRGLKGLLHVPDAYGELYRRVRKDLVVK